MAAAFLTPLRMEKIGPRRWLLIDDLIFRSELYAGKVIAMRGFQTDLASIPRLFWVIAPKVDLYDQAAVIHDGGYGNALYTENGDRMFTVKAVADKLFLEGMLAMGVSGWRARLMFKAVDLFGSPVGHPLRATRLQTGDMLI